MKVAIGADHAGYELKEILKGHLLEKGFDVMDVGTDSPDSTDYPIYAYKVSRAVSSRECDFGVLICTTGLGMAIAANKVKGIRAVSVCNKDQAVASRRHNDANVLCLAAKYVSHSEAVELLDLWLSTEFEGAERHVRRLKEVSMIEEGAIAGLLDSESRP